MGKLIFLLLSKTKVKPRERANVMAVDIHKFRLKSTRTNFIFLGGVQEPRHIQICLKPKTKKSCSSIVALVSTEERVKP